jgi:hypothetical protein
VVDRGVDLEGVAPSFQFGASISVNFTVQTDGSISGSVSDVSHRFSFSFGPHIIQSTGDNIAFAMGGPDPRGGANYTYATLDNVTVAVPGDANGDAKVDLSDLLILAQNYVKSGGASFSQGDFDNDGKVDFADLLILAQNYGVGGAAAELVKRRAAWPRQPLRMLAERYA